MGRVRGSMVAALIMLVSLVTPAGAAAANTPPSVPMGRSVGGCVFVCASATRTAGVVTKDSTPLLTGLSRDANGDRLRYRFQLARGSKIIADVTTARLPVGAVGSYQVPRALPNAGDYRYRVVATDGVRASAWSGWIGFAIDTVRPTAPKLEVVTQVSTNPDSFAGRVGVTPVDVTLSERSASDRVVRYLWSLAPMGSVNSPPGSWECSDDRVLCLPTVNADIEIPTFTVRTSVSTLQVWAVDAVGNVSPNPTTAAVDFFAFG